MLDPPDRIPLSRCSLPERTGPSWIFLGCCHGLAAFLDLIQLEAVVWEPVTGRQCSIAFPPEVKFDEEHNIFNGVVLSAANVYGDGYTYTHNDLRLNPFKLVLLFTEDKEKLACVHVYESESGKWGNISSITMPAGSDLLDPGVLVGDALCWILGWGGGILAFNLGTHSLAIIQRMLILRWSHHFMCCEVKIKDSALLLRQSHN